MLIILEGSDCAGKTSLARQLSDAAFNQGINTILMSAGPPEPGLSALDEYELLLRPVREHAIDPRHLIILDRWHLGELVYGPLLRGESRLSAAQFEHVERFLDAMGAVRVIVHPLNEDVLRTRFTARGDDLLSEEQVVTVWRWYLNAAQTYRWRQVHSPVPHKTVLDLLMWANVDCLRAQRLADFPAYVGSCYPNVLVVGDEPNGWLIGTDPNPALMPYHRNSAHYLISAMLESVTTKLEYGLANANDGTDIEALWQALDRPRVVALGKRCQRTLDVSEVPYQALPHPQWVKRFRYADRLAYGHAVVHGAPYPACGGVYVDDVA